MFSFFALIAALSQSLGSASKPPECREWRECRQLALDALARHDYETSHDLAWRAVQKGPARDPMLMYLLARAQSLSNRPHDALVMLRRLAEMGVPSDAATSGDFAGVRTLREWPELEALLAALPAPGATASATASIAPRSSAATPLAPPPTAAPAVPASPLPPVEPRAAASPANASAAPNARFKAEDTLRLPAPTLNPRGLAYDGVSGRFVVSDRIERKLVILDERSKKVIDFVRAGSAGFSEITAFEIDSRRGDLWVASADGTGSNVSRSSGTTLHRVQLISGRPLETVPVPDDLRPARLADVAVTPEGMVYVLDAVGARILRRRPETRDLAVAVALQTKEPTSIAPVDEVLAYVANRTTLVRVDMATGAQTMLHGPKEASLAGFEHIRWNRNALVGIQRLADGQRRAVIVHVSGAQVTSIEVVQPEIAMVEPTAVSMSGEDFYFLAREPQGDGNAEIVVRKIRLR